MNEVLDLLKNPVGSKRNDDDYAFWKINSNMNAERLAKSTANFAKLSARSADYKLKMQSDSDEENVD